jgi:hypothetical protein
MLRDFVRERAVFVALAAAALPGLAVSRVVVLGPFAVLAGLALIGTIGALIGERLSPDTCFDEEESA